MKDGSEADMRRAYALPGDEEVAAVGPMDPQIGILRIDHADGRPLAVLYNFACHPIMHPPHMGNSADLPGFASKAIEDALGGGAIAFFVQGCAGDINPVRYKAVTHPPSAEALGDSLGLAVMRAWRPIETKPGARLRVVNDTVALPRSTDFERRLAALAAEQAKLVAGLQPTDINFKTFLPLFVQHKLSPDFPSYYAQGYLHDRALGRDDLAQLDTTNRASIEAYLHNIATMERLTRLNTNAALLRMHQAQTVAAGRPTVDAELTGIRIGDFTLVACPGELTVTIGLGIKKRAPRPHTFVAGCTNGYLYYLPTAQQRAKHRLCAGGLGLPRRARVAAAFRSACRCSAKRTRWAVNGYREGFRPDDRYYGRKPEAPTCHAKTVLGNIERHVFAETRLTAYRVKNAA